MCNNIQLMQEFLNTTKPKKLIQNTFFKKYNKNKNLNDPVNIVFPSVTLLKQPVHNNGSD